MVPFEGFEELSVDTAYRTPKQTSVAISTVDGVLHADLISRACGGAI